MAYVTCSPVLDETVRVVDAVLADATENADVAAVRCDARGILKHVVRDGAHIPVPEGSGDVQLFEQIHDTDQMFIAVLRRVR